MIQTERLLLRPMVAADAGPLLRVFADPRVMASFGVAPFGSEQMEQWVARNLAHQDAHGYGLFSVLLNESGLLIGDCGLTRMELNGASEVELGYDLRSDYWNQGLATEAARAVRDYAFAVLLLPRLVSLVRQGNRASRRVAEKVGMRFAADLVEDGRDYWLFALERAGG
ncbi:MAG TPA: GNAT family N-acetyltransferase [Thermomicrobiaceae bacterium]|nr:GNAT family N-acetyltransferase [Thermomicrobiaceae bacterium]